jgi:hypothetical protein
MDYFTVLNVDAIMCWVFLNKPFLFRVLACRKICSCVVSAYVRQGILAVHTICGFTGSPPLDFFTI